MTLEWALQRLPVTDMLRTVGAPDARVRAGHTRVIRTQGMLAVHIW
jgi:hypothetical protein